MLVADEAGQTGTGIYEDTAAAFLKSLGVEVVTFSGEPATYDMMGPAYPLGADIHAVAMAFLRRRAGL